MKDKKNQIASILLDTGAVKLNVESPFVFSSGILSPIYCDNRFLLGFEDERDIIVEAFIDLPTVREADVIVGTATAGIPCAAILADRLGKPMGYVRSTAKDHGTSKFIEGAEVRGKNVVVIEDLISTGQSAQKVIEKLSEQGVVSQKLCAIFSYGFPESRDLLGDFHSLSDFTALIACAKTKGILTNEEQKAAASWNQDPHSWS